MIHGRYRGSGYKTFTIEGRRFRVLLGNTPEEVEQWKAERRRNYPTAANVARKLRARGDHPSSTRGKRPREGTAGISAASSSSSSLNPPPTKQSKVVGLVSYGSESDDDDDDDDPHAKDTEVAVPTSEGTNHPTTSDEAPKTKSLLHGVCWSYLRNQCNNGMRCRYRHGPTKRRGRKDAAPAYCRFYLRDGCKKGENCAFTHDDDLKEEYNVMVAQKAANRAAAKQQQPPPPPTSHDDSGNKQDHATVGSLNAGETPSQVLVESSLAPSQGHIPPPTTTTTPAPSTTPSSSKNKRGTPPPVVVAPAKPTLLKKLLEKDKARETRLVLECIRFIVQADFCKPKAPKVVGKDPDGVNGRDMEVEKCTNSSNSNDDDGVEEQHVTVMMEQCSG